MANKRKPREKEVVGFLGVGLDSTDAETRITRSEHFLLLGGSAETHERMQDTAIRFGEALEQRGKRLADASPQEALDMLRKAMDV